MTSDDSDDEPLSVLVAQKRLNPEKYVDSRFIEIEDAEVAKKKKKKYTLSKRVSMSINLKKPPAPPPVIERPDDVWLYMKDFNTAGPYSCLLCAEWFINRSKIILHYILNHKKDFCGICRYFVPDRDAWWEHLKYHTPWPCSQCVQNFESEALLRHHLSTVHKLVHCRLCHFRVSDGDQYNSHLFQKHNVTNVSSKDEENIWELEYDGAPNFLCLLCTKSNNLAKNFFNHYMGFHHFTLKCFANIICGKDQPFLVTGADLRSEFIEDQLKNQSRIGYIDVESKNTTSEGGQDLESASDSKDLLKVLITEMKEENNSGDGAKNDEEGDENKKEASKDEDDPYKSYNGDNDFDVTLMELIILQKCYFDYVNQTLTDINENIVPQNSDIVYEKPILDNTMLILCSLCRTHYNSVQTFTSHMMKMHSVKALPTFSCRVCATPFDSQNELDSHIAQELGDFDDLWICQFCDKEFDNRAATRQHLTEHVDTIEYDNCFSPHLGFKCRYCPTLFWNETDREAHQVRAHFTKHKEDYYNCDKCNEIFSDKVWFIHHYLEKHKTEDKVPIFLLKCCICCLVLPNVADMRDHFNSAHPEAKKVFCSIDPCKYKPLSHRKSFKLHVKTVHNPRVRQERSVECSICNREFNSPRACATHVSQVHGAAKFKCKLCPALLHTNDERKLHYLLRHPGQHPFECSECGKSFQYKSSLYMHKQEHQPNKENYKCNYCGKSFMKRDSYREHVQIHEGPRHACSYCPMRFVQRSNMLRHERRHTGERPYACPHCPRNFADKGACTSHTRTHSKESSFACMYCGQTFVQKSKLTYHIRKHTGENLETCPVCSKLFTSACSLREHMKIHNTNKQSVKCPLCDKKYQDERYMLRHLRTAHTRGRFTCPVCGKHLTTPTGLRHHVITHGAIKAFKCKQCSKGYKVKRTMIKHLRRRHGLKGTEINIKDFYRRLEPRELQLNLDEDVMTTIFGPSKKTTTTDLLISDFVTITQQLVDGKKTEDAQEENNKSESEDESEKDSDSDGNRPIKVEKMDDSDQGYTELEPTDFVSVKIEPLDEDETA